MEQLSIEVNLSIEKSGGKENLDKLILALSKELPIRYPSAKIAVRKGFFQTIDGITINDDKVYLDVVELLEEYRANILNESK